MINIKKELPFILITILGILGNIFNLNMFFGVNFIFGTIFVFVNIWYFGFKRGIISAILIHSYTIFLWGHYYAFIIFILEAIVIGHFLQKKTNNLLLIDLFYWIFIGIWLVIFFYSQFLELNKIQYILIALKQLINGIFNALCAMLIFSISSKYLKNKEKISFKNYLFLIIMSFVIISIFIITRLNSITVFNISFKNINDNLNKTAKQVKSELDRYLGYSDEFLFKTYKLYDALKYTHGENIIDLNDSYSFKKIFFVPNGEEKKILIASQKGFNIPFPNTINIKFFCKHRIFLDEKDKILYIILKIEEGFLIGIERANILNKILFQHNSIKNFYIVRDNYIIASDNYDNLKDYSFKSLFSEDSKKYPNNIYHILPSGKMAEIERWKRSYFLKELDIDIKKRCKIYIKEPYGSYIDKQHHYYIQTFAIMIAIILMAMIVSFIVSKKLIISIDLLKKTTQNLPNKLLENKKIDWGGSQIEEFDSLAKNFKLISQTLIDIFRETKTKYKQLFESSENAIVVICAKNLKIIDLNLKAIELLEKSKYDLIDENIHIICKDLRKNFLINFLKMGMEEIVYLDNSENTPVKLNIMPVTLKKKPAWLINFIDISKDLKNKRSLDLIATVFNTTSEGIIVTDRNKNILMVNSGFSKITGYSKEEVIYKTPQILKSGWQDQKTYMDIWEAINKNGYWEGELWNRKKDGSLYAQWITVYQIIDENGQIINYFATFMDITDKKRNQERINQLAFYDILTSLPNRALFRNRIEYSIDKAKRENSKFALMFLDLDDFKKINDTLGHDKGDLLLKKFSNRVLQILRNIDTMARLGGDEFTIILENIKISGEVSQIAKRILSELNKPFDLDGNEVFTSASIGICFFPNDAKNIDGLMKCADIAMYRAKERGKRKFEFYTKKLNEEIDKKIKIENGLRKSIENGELKLLYQPQIDDKKKIIGVEALLRWNNPTINISPDIFIPIAEASGIMGKIENWVVKEATSQLQKWIDKGIKIKMAINISNHQFKKNDFIENLKQQINCDDINCKYIDLELTERIIAQDNTTAVNKILELKRYGFSISLDDFGTGYSSLSYLQKFSIDKVKIDKSFIQEIPYNKNSCSITEAIISMSKALNMNVIAEGVENESQVEMLKNKGCFLYQGYFYSKPLNSKDFEKFYFSYMS